MPSPLGHAVAVTVTVALDGEIDAATVDPMKAKMAEAIDANPGSRVTIDFARVTFLDSTGLGALVSAMRRARSNGGDVALANVAPNVRKVFDITGLDRVFDIS